jgi:hypothetical protein
MFPVSTNVNLIRQLLEQIAQYYLLLLRGSIIQSAPATATTNWSIVLLTWLVIIPDSSTRPLCAGWNRGIYSEMEMNLATNIREFCLHVYLFMPRSILYHTIKSYDMGPPALLPIRRKVCCGFLEPLKTHRPRPGFNPLTLGPVASTLTSKSPRTITPR